ncbi:MAG: Competence protein A [Microgenomates bacterium OLB22]|nr:MAG: Competence protein A [Microgenomates bacterium OLB22]
MPTLTEKEMISAIKYQADQFIPVPIDKVTISLEMLEENKKAKITKTLIVAAPNSHIHRITQLCEELALYPLNMENEVSAYFRILRHLKNTGLSPQIPSEGHLLVANIGSEATSLYVYDVVTMTPVMVHTFSIGTSLWVKDLMTNLQLDEQKAAQLLATSGLLATGADKKTTVMGPVLAEYLGEIKRYLLSLRQRTDTTIAPAKCLVLGSGAQVPGVEQALSQSTNLPVEMLSYEPWLTQNEVSQYFAKELYAFVPCVGASLVE